MKLKVNNIHISTGRILVAVLNKKDAAKAHLRQGDRMIITGTTAKNHNEVTAIVDITTDENVVAEGHIGIFNEAFSKGHFRNGSYVNVRFAPKPDSVRAIRKKLGGEKLTTKETTSIIEDIAANKLTDIEITYFVASGYINEFTDEEVVSMINTMVKGGDQLKFKDKIVMDKHCIGGVAANRTTCVVVPIIAAAGITIPKTSSRSITSPAGTADTMEVLCSVSHPLKDVKKIVQKTNGCLVWGGAVNLAPADDLIIKIEHPMSLDPVGQLITSILAKKKCVGSTHVLIDIPFGKGAKVDNKQRAIELKERFEKIGKKIGMHVHVEITNGEEPIGNGIGPVLEARDIVNTLQNNAQGSYQLRKKAIAMAGKMLEMAKKAKKGSGAIMAREILDSGQAYDKFCEILIAQGGKKPTMTRLKLGRFQKDIKSKQEGTILKINNRQVSTVAKIAGAPADKQAGIYLNHHVGEHIRKGANLYTIYAQSEEKLQLAIKEARKDSGITVKSGKKRTNTRK